MTVEDLPCQELVELITEYLEGTLAPSLMVRLDRHLAECPFCVEFVDQMRRTIELTGCLSSSDVDLSSRERLLEAFRGWQEAEAP